LIGRLALFDSLNDSMSYGFSELGASVDNGVQFGKMSISSRRPPIMPFLAVSCWFSRRSC
jgi:hypothetical protein